MGKWLQPVHTARNGQKVRSKLEARVLNDLDRRGIPYEYEPVVLGWLDKVNKGRCLLCNSGDVVKHRSYIPDLRLANGSFVEVKGLFTAEDRRTLIGARRDNPGMVLRILFMRDGWLSNKRKANRYSDWAYKNQFECAIGEGVPDTWQTDQSTSSASNAGSVPRSLVPERAPTRRGSKSPASGKPRRSRSTKA